MELYSDTCCKAFNHACTYVQQQMHKEVMLLFRESKDVENEVPKPEDIKEMCLRSYSLLPEANLKKAIFYLDKLLPSIARGESS